MKKISPTDRRAQYRARNDEGGRDARRRYLEPPRLGCADSGLLSGALRPQFFACESLLL